MPLGREIWIEQDDFMETPAKGFFRLSPGEEVRLRYGYVIRCNSVVKNSATGEIEELHCTYDPATQGGSTSDGRRVRGTIHWVSAAHAVPAEVRLYDRLFSTPNPEEVEEGKSFLDYLNPDSVQILTGCMVEPSVASSPPGRRYQFERQGYFISDSEDSAPGALVFNRIVPLRDTWAKIVEPSSGSSTSAARLSTEEENAPAVVGARSETRDRARLDDPILAARLTRFNAELGVGFVDADILSGDRAIGDFFEAALAVHNSPATVANWITNVLLAETKEISADQLAFDGAAFGKLVALVDAGAISNNIGKDLLNEMLTNGGDPEVIVEARGLEQISDADLLTEIIDSLIAKHGDKAEQYRSGKTGLLGFFVGQAMRATQGKANPQLVQQLVLERLTAS
ncbi:MAG: hypothetical protein HC802_05975 [Caldilineaceae bacterium]|nr:hypothetical protein [Caldilineaceae bacterium]